MIGSTAEPSHASFACRPMSFPGASQLRSAVEAVGKAGLCGATRNVLDRRQFLVGALLAGSTTALQPPGPAFIRRRPPNFLVILADDLGWGDLGCYGNSAIRTPNLDRLASSGTRFLQFYAAAPLCTPSRAGLLTGRLPARFGLTHVLGPLSRGGLPSTEKTLASWLKLAGYTTACIGKWHLGHLPQFLPTRHGFHTYFGIPYSNDMSAQAGAHAFLYSLRLLPPLPLIRDEHVVEREPDQRFLLERFTSEAIRFLQRVASPARPFFLYLAYHAPHRPLHPHPQFAGHSSSGKYGDVVEELDAHVGALLEALRRLGLVEDTLVLFTSDNGPVIGGSGEGSAGPFRGGKGTAWEGGFRVPCVACWPGRVPEGMVSSAFFTALDITPTLMSLAGLRPSSQVLWDGRDATSALVGEPAARDPQFFFWLGRRVWAVRKGPWKLHLTVMPETGLVVRRQWWRPYLCRLDTDPGEQCNLAAEQPGLVEELRELALRHQREVLGRA